MIKIINETGASQDTKIINTKTGENILDILPIQFGATIRLDQDGVVAEMEVALIKLDLAINKTTYNITNPVTGDLDAIRAIEFADGKRIEFDDDGVPTMKEPS